jgi:hypothetical protein
MTAPPDLPLLVVVVIVVVYSGPVTPILPLPLTTPPGLQLRDAGLAAWRLFSQQIHCGGPVINSLGRFSCFFRIVYFVFGGIWECEPTFDLLPIYM